MSVLVGEKIIRVAVDWFGSYAQIEKREIEMLFSKLTRLENITIRKSLASIFTLEDDKWSMLDILDGVNVLHNTLAICLRSIKNGNNLSEIIEKTPFDCAKFAFLIARRHLTLYYKVETQKDDEFFLGSKYQSIYKFCKIFSVDNKLSVLLMNNLNIRNISDWLNFDHESTQEIIKLLHDRFGVKDFQDICLLLSREPECQEVLNDIRAIDAKQVEFKLIQLRKIITRFMRKWDFLDF